MDFVQACDSFYQLLKEGETILNALADSKIKLPLQMTSQELVDHFLGFSIKKESPLFGLSLPKIYQKLPRAVCGAVLDSISVRCMTCSNDSNSVYCKDCFDENAHIGHNYVYFEGSGMCDCGFVQTIKPSGFCPRHCGDFERVLRETSLNFDERRMQAWFQYANACALYFIHIISYEDSAAVGDVAGCDAATALEGLSTVLSAFTLLLKDCPVDYFKFQFTRSICARSYHLTLEELCSIGNARQMYMEFVDLRATIAEFRLNAKYFATKVPPVLIYFIMPFFSRKLLEPPEQEFQQYLAFYQVSEPVFREVMCFNYYIIKPFFCETFFDASANVCGFIFPSAEYKQAFCASIEQPPTNLYEISVQTHNCVDLPDGELNVSQSMELLRDYIAALHLNEEEEFWFSLPIEAYVECAVAELGRQYELSGELQKYMRETISTVVLTNRSLQTINNIEITKSGNAAKLSLLASAFLTTKFSQKNAFFVSALFRGKLSCFAYFNYFSLFAAVYFPRYVERKPENDITLARGCLEYYNSTHIYMTTMLYCVFYIFQFDRKKEQRNMLMRITDIIESPFCDPCNIDIAENITLNCLLQLVRFASCKHNGFDLKQRKYEFAYEKESYHCFKSEFKENSSQEQYHLVSECFSAFLATVLNAYETYHQARIQNFELSRSRFLVHILENNVFNIEEEQFPHEPIDLVDLIANIPVRVLVSEQLFFCKAFARLGENIVHCFQQMYNQKLSNGLYLPYFEYQLLQQLMVFYYEETDDEKLFGFFKMIAEQYGVFSLKYNSFSLGNDNEQFDRRVKMLAGYIKILGILLFEPLSIKSCQEWIQMQMKQLGFNWGSLFMSQIVEAFEEEEFEAPSTLINLFSQLSSREDPEQHSELYCSGVLATKFSLADHVVESVDIFNPFLIEEAQTTYLFEQKRPNDVPPCMKRSLHFSDIFQKVALEEFVFTPLREFFDLYAQQVEAFTFVSQNELLMASYLLHEVFLIANDDIRSEIKALVVSMQHNVLPQTLKNYLTLCYGEKPKNSNEKLGSRLRHLKEKITAKGDELLMSHADIPSSTVDESTNAQINDSLVQTLKEIDKVHYQCSVCIGVEKDKVMGVMGMIQPTAMLFRILNKDRAPDSIKFALEQQRPLLTHELEIPPLTFSVANMTELAKISKSYECAGLALQPKQLCEDFYDPADNFVGVEFRSCSHIAHTTCHFRKMPLESISCPLCRKVTPQTFPFIETKADITLFLAAVLSCASQIMEIVQQGSPEYIEDPLLSDTFVSDIVGYLQTGKLTVSHEALIAFKLRGIPDGLIEEPLFLYLNELFRIINMYCDLVFQATLLGVFEGQLAATYHISCSLVFQARWLFELLAGKYTPYTVLAKHTVATQFEILFAKSQSIHTTQLFREEAAFRYLVLFPDEKLKRLPLDVFDEQLWDPLLRIVQVSQEMFIDFVAMDIEKLQKDLHLIAQLSKERVLLGEELDDAETFLIVSRLVKIKQLLHAPNSIQLSGELSRHREQMATLPRYSYASNYQMPRFKFQFPQNAFTLLRDENPCKQHNNNSIIQCLYCGEQICLKCCKEKIYEHSRSCFITGAWFVKFENIILFPDVPNFTHIAGGPYVDQYLEDDVQFLKRIPMQLNETLLNNLRVHMELNATGEVDTGKNVINFIVLMQTLLK